MSYVWASLLVLTLALGWAIGLLGMPGNWVIVAAAAAYAFLVPGPSILAVGWPVVLGLIVLACLGELLEFLAGALGVGQAGGSRRGAVMALVGSLLGGGVGLFVGLPIPLVGSLAAAVLFAGFGALLGAIWGERSAGREFGASWKIGKAAFWGRLLGTAAKSAIGAVMVVIVIVAMLT